MALWLARAGSHGEYEQKFLKEGRIYFTWNDLKEDLSKANELAEMYEIFRNVYPDKASNVKEPLSSSVFASGIGMIFWQIFTRPTISYQSPFARNCHSSEYGLWFGKIR